VHLIAVLLALASALAFATATVGQQRAAATSSDADARRGRFIGQLLRNPLWIAATLGNGLGYGLQAAALGVGAVVLVQPILVTSLLFALPLSARLARRRLPGQAAWWALLLATSLAVFEILGRTDEGVAHGASRGWLVVAAVGAPLVAGCLINAHGRSGAIRASLLAIPVGLLGGVLAVLTKSVVDAAGNGIIDLFRSGETYALLVVGIGGFYLQQLSFQAGALQASLPIMTVLEPVTAAVLGVTLLHERLSTDAPRQIAIAAAALAMISATIALARTQARASSAISRKM
jgi:drug/metabolite transporter (DMT)-like permease